MHYCLAIAMIFPVMLYGADRGDAVNERIPVTAIQLEAHWGIDCSASWASLEAGTCPPASGLSRVLQLCAAIYQRPGDANPINCPDYAGAAAALASGDCGQLQRIVLASSKCPN